MLAQFQVRYPTGSLISELLTIYQGKFVVRVSAQVEGVTRATGMAAAETLELAEDRARSRALAVLAIDPIRPTTNHSSISATITGLNDLAYSSFSQASFVEESTPAPAVSPAIKGNEHPLFPTPPAQEPNAAVENFGLISSNQTESSGEAPISFGNVTPLVPRSYNTQESSRALEQKGAETATAASEPIDLSDAIARTSVELKRLGWSHQQGREYTQRNYGKRSRQELTDEEMLEFLHYLESQPSPNKPFA